ncbi:MAG TPA: hypothetical protein VFS36_01535 [Chitinophagaceae bacterium]|jgi:hypothetical protein|nr:hypothetical protein [Chitinophagaceae bacterium]
MYTGLLHLHSFLRWVILLLLVIIVLRSLAAGSRPFNQTDKKLGLFAMIACDITLLVGLYQWAFGDTWGLISIKTRGFAEVMKDPVARFFAVEHMAGMLLAIILVHIGKGYAKKNLPDNVKHKRTLVFFGLALLIILVSIPWPFRVVGAGRGWF